MNYPSHRVSGLKFIFGAVFMAGVWAGPLGHADEIFNSDFSKGSIDHLVWKSKGIPWQKYDYGASKADLKNNPGFVIRFPAEKEEQQGTLTRKFPVVTDPASLTLTFDAGWGWGQSGQGGDTLDIMILDDDGNGYIFNVHRTKATWAAQWGKVTAYEPQKPQLNWASAEIDASQDSVLDGGGLQTFTITRDNNGAWIFNGAKWTGGPLAFSDTTTKSFSQVVLVGNANIDEPVFNKIKLEATK